MIQIIFGLNDVFGNLTHTYLDCILNDFSGRKIKYVI